MSAAAAAARRKRRPMVQAEAARHLRRATLGVQLTEIAAATGQRVDQWVDAQLALPVVPNQMRTIFTTNRLPGFASGPVIENGWAGIGQYLNWKYQQPEKLRTRLVWAIQEFFSVGGVETMYGFSQPHAMLWDIFESEATNGTFLSMLRRVSRSQMMSQYLTYWLNRRSENGVQPDENYAREIMQLFSIGLWMLHLDGRIMVSGELDPGDPRYIPGGTDEVPTYGQSDITNVARVFTGMCNSQTYDGTTLAPFNDSFLFGPQRGSSEATDLQGNTGWWSPLVYAPAYHEDRVSKVALQGRVNIPAGTGGNASFDALHLALVNHPSCAPYVAGRFIRLLTTSNPSPAYIARVASVFRNDGTGQVGNMRAFFRAILLDQEALAPIERGLTTRVPTFFEQRMAVLLGEAPPLTTEGAPNAQGTGAHPGSTGFEYGTRGMGLLHPGIPAQQPSVFGSFPALFQPQGAVADAGLVAPELATFGETDVSDWLNSSDVWQIAGNMASAQDLTDCTTTGNRAALLQRLNVRMTGGTAPASLITALTDWLTTRTANDVQSLAETYRSLVAAFALTPAGYTRR
jgi:uncharacterized protein (DUF1800 family)